MELLLPIVSLLLPLVAADCPPRTPESWEHDTRRTDMLSAYNKYAMRCPHVNMVLFPYRLQVDRDLGHASLKMSVILEWSDPDLVVPASDGVTLRVNSSDIWTPQLVTTTLDSASLAPDSQASLCEVEPARGRVRALITTSLRGLCYSSDASAWPRDTLHCDFWLQDTDRFNLTQTLSTQSVRDTLRKLNMERMSSWRLTKMESRYFGMVWVEAALERLPGQLEALVVHPGCAVAALAPASAALPPGCSGRAALLAMAVLLHAMHLLSLPERLADLDGSAAPRNVLLFRDAGLLILLVVLQWLVSLHLASRRRPLPAWLRPASRALAVLRTPLLLAAAPAEPRTGQPPDAESVGLSEVLDRLTTLAAGATYLALVIVSL